MASEVSLIDALVDSGLAVTPKGEVTRGQARKLIASNAITVNGSKTTDDKAVLVSAGAFHERYFLVKKGKNNTTFSLKKFVRKILNYGSWFSSSDCWCL